MKRKKDSNISIWLCTALTQTCGSFNLLGHKRVEFFKLVQFYECWQDARLSACIKYDIERQHHQYELDGIGDFLMGHSMADKRYILTSTYYNSGDKMGGLWDFMWNVKTRHCRHKMWRQKFANKDYQIF